MGEPGWDGMPAWSSPSWAPSLLAFLGLRGASRECRAGGAASRRTRHWRGGGVPARSHLRGQKGQRRQCWGIETGLARGLRWSANSFTTGTLRTF